MQLGGSIRPRRAYHPHEDRSGARPPFAVVLAALTALIPPAAADRDEPKPVKPVNLDCNTKADEDDPFTLQQRRHLYYTCNADKKFDLMVVETRRRKWAAGKPLGGYSPDEAADERGAFVTADSIYPQYLYFATNKDAKDEKGDNFDIYVTYRDGATKDFVPPEAVQRRGHAGRRAGPVADQGRQDAVFHPQDQGRLPRLHGDAHRTAKGRRVSTSRCWWTNCRRASTTPR